MNFEKWTAKAQNAVMECQNIAISEGHQQMDAANKAMPQAPGPGSRSNDHICGLL